MTDEEKVKATVYRERTPPKTAIDQWRALEGEVMEETNTERERFMDFRERLSLALSLIDNELLTSELNGGLPDEVAKKRHAAVASRLATLRKELGDASFPDSWAQAAEIKRMPKKLAVAWNYQVLNAKLSVSLSKARALLIALGVYPAESEDDAEDRVISEVYGRPRTK